MANLLTRALVIATVAVATSRLLTYISTPITAHSLPVFYFHGLTANSKTGYYMQQNLSTEARPFISLSFCENECSLTDLRVQTKLAIDQIRSIIANDIRFENGYSFVAHSQGTAIARAVIEEMDDHKVHTFISLAGVGNGIFYGPQENDFLPAKLFIEVFAPVIVDQSLVKISDYSEADIPTGRMQIDTIKLHLAHPELQDAGSGYQLTRSPAKSVWLGYNKFLAVINNLQKSTNATILEDQARRKRNFLKLKAAHFFASPYDEVASPWQTSILGQYNEVASMEELESKYRELKVISMRETEEYVNDTYGIRTLDERGGVTLNTIEGVGHGCWVADTVPTGRTKECKWRPVFEQSVYPLLKPLE